MPGRKYPPILERFWAKIAKDRSGCWNWIGCKNNWGYPTFWENGKVLLGHKWAYQRFVGPVPEGKCLMHACDNPSCCNPGHMSVGTLSENSRDCLHKNRKKTAKLTVEQVREIRAELKDRPINFDLYIPLSEKYGVQVGTIYCIHAKRTWKWVA